MLKSFIWRGFLPLLKIIDPNDSELLDQVNPGFSVLLLLIVLSEAIIVFQFFPPFFFLEMMVFPYIICCFIEFSDYRIAVWCCD